MFLLLVLIRNPLSFLKSIAYLLLLLVHRQPYYVYITNHNSVLMEAIGRGLSFDETDGLGFAYTAAHNIARIELYMASRTFALRGSVGHYFWRKPFGPVTPGDFELHGLCDVANKLTGSMTHSRLGVAATQDSVERILLFPRYLRCVFGLLFDALQGGIRGNESRVFVTSTLGIAAVIFGLIYEF